MNVTLQDCLATFILKAALLALFSTQTAGKTTRHHPEVLTIPFLEELGG